VLFYKHFSKYATSQSQREREGMEKSRKREEKGGEEAATACRHHKKGILRHGAFMFYL